MRALILVVAAVASLRLLRWRPVMRGLRFQTSFLLPNSIRKQMYYKKSHLYLLLYCCSVPAAMLYYSTPVESYLSEQVRPAPLHLLLSKYIDYMRPVFL